MAKSGVPGEAKTSRSSIGKTDRGFVLPSGVTFRDRSKLVQYLRNNPGVMWKHRGYIRSQLGDEVIGLAGYNLSDKGDRMQQYDGVPGRSTKMIRAWTPNQKEAAGLKTRSKMEGTKVIKVAKPTGPKYQGKGGAPYDKIPKGTDLQAPFADNKGAAKTPPGKITKTSAGLKAINAASAAKQMPGAAGKTKTRTAAAATQGNSLMDLALQRLLGLDTRGGFKAIDPNAILSGMTTDTESQVSTIRNMMADLEKQGEFNTQKIGDWFNQVGKSVDTAKTRGMEMTKGIGENLAGNNAAILGSIGGEAALGKSPVAQVAQSGQNTLAAMGAADAQFLNDMGPLLQGEGRSLQAAELGRLAQMRRELQGSMASIKTEGNDKRAALALQIAQSNNEGRQQQFSNAAGLGETLAGLAMSGQKLDADQRMQVAQLMARQSQNQADQANEDRDYKLDWAKMIYGAQSDQADLVTKAQQDEEDRKAGMVKSQDQKLAAANRDIRKIINPANYPLFKPNKLAPAGMVQDVLNAYRAAGVDLSDPRAKKAAQAIIRTYGVHVDPKWIRGWD
jgi:hypothetical protein